jgi:hypothetical protein
MAILCAALAPAAAGAGTSAPLRHLVYSFTFEMRENGAVPNEAGSTGNRTYKGTLDDKGTMTVDVLREAADRGLLVVISEEGIDTRKAAPATCAVYGNTDVICDLSKTVNIEEYTLLRFLGANFVDPANVDEKGHWTISVNRGPTSLTADYTINSNDGGELKIDEQRHVKDKSQGFVTSDSETKIDYSGTRLVPVSIEEYKTEDRHAGIGGVSTTVYQTTLTLTSDSMAK